MSSSWTGGLGAARAPGSGPASAWVAALALTPDQIRRARRILLVVGILTLLAGVAAIIVPIAASVTMTIFIGWLLMFHGIVSGIDAFSSDSPRKHKAWRVLNAVLALAVGFYLVVLPLSGTITLTLLLSAWFFATGVTALLAAWQHRHEPGVGWAAVNGVLATIGGLLIALSLPSSAAWAIGLVVGVYMIWWAIDALVAASLLKRVERELPPGAPA